ncbi:TetR family transcriptional regulator C-terminal domain-containing protein [Actinomadura sp. ATCC 39365]
MPNNRIATPRENASAHAHQPAHPRRTRPFPGHPNAPTPPAPPRPRLPPAVELGELPPKTDPAQLAYEIDALREAVVPHTRLLGRGEAAYERAPHHARASTPSALRTPHTTPPCAHAPHHPTPRTRPTPPRSRARPSPPHSAHASTPRQPPQPHLRTPQAPAHRPARPPSRTYIPNAPLVSTARAYTRPPCTRLYYAASSQLHPLWACLSGCDRRATAALASHQPPAHR